MIKRILILIFGSVASLTFAQNEISIDCIKLKECSIEENQMISDTVYGILCTGNKLVVSADSKVQMSCNYGNPSSNQYQVVKNRLSIQLFPDSLGKLRDSMLFEILSYTDKQELWAKEYNVNSFSNLAYYKSFYFSDSTIIPTVWSGSERNGDYYLCYLDNTLIRIELIDHQGLGALSSFFRQNFVFLDESHDLNLTRYIKSTEEVRKILEAYNIK